MAGSRRFASLARRCPGRIDVPALLLAAAGLLTAGIVLPALETRTLFFWRDEYSVLMNVVELHREGKEVAAMILALCSIVYPASKLVALAFFWVAPFPQRSRFRLIRTLRLLGRWSMLDVFAMTAIVVGSFAIGPVNSTPRPGLYLYAGGILCLMLVTLLMDVLARRVA